MGGCDVKRDPNAGAYLQAVKGTVCHIPGDYLSKTQQRLGFQETARKSNFLDRSNRLVLKFFLFFFHLRSSSLRVEAFPAQNLFTHSHPDFFFFFLTRTLFKGTFLAFVGRLPDTLRRD